MTRRGVFIFEEPKFFRELGIESEPIKNYTSFLYGSNRTDTCVWIPPPGIEKKSNQKICKIVEKDFCFQVSTGYFLPRYRNILVFGSEISGISPRLTKFIIEEVGATPVHIPVKKDFYGKNSDTSLNLINSILMSLTVLRSPLFKIPSFSSKKEISFWFPHWHSSEDEKGNGITTRMIGSMTHDILLNLGKTKIYWNYLSSSCQTDTDISVSKGLLKKEILDISFPSFDSSDVLLIDIVIHPPDSIEDWERFPIIYFGSKKKVLVSITDVESRGLYQPPNSIRLDYGSSPSTAMAWFLGLL